MSYAASIIIFFLSIVTLVAEAILFLMLGIGAAVTGRMIALFNLPYFFIGLMLVTGVIGLVSPMCAFIESKADKKNLGYKTLLILILTTIVLYNFYVITVLVQKASFL